MCLHTHMRGGVGGMRVCVQRPVMCCCFQDLLVLSNGDDATCRCVACWRKKPVTVKQHTYLTRMHTYTYIRIEIHVHTHILEVLIASLLYQKSCC